MSCILWKEVRLIQSFGDPATADLHHRRKTARVRRFPHTVVPATLRKLDLLDAALLLDHLRMPPGNRLEALQGDLAGWHSIRVNDQWRLIFIWNDPGPNSVSLVDYHS